MLSWLSTLSLLALAGLAMAQSYTSCNPLTTTCPADQALGTKVSFDFQKQTFNPKLWKQNGGTVGLNTDGAQFTITRKLDSPTLTSLFYIFGGRVECIMRAAPGAGVISTLTLLSNDLDEIDVEIIGNNVTSWQSNYFGKGDTTTPDRGQFHPISDPTVNYHNYTVVWTKSKIEWTVDNEVIRTLNYAGAAGGSRFPQTPMAIKLGVWPGGDPGNGPGVIEWAGGAIDYSKGPFTMSVKSLYVEDYSSGRNYTYGDRSGSWDSIVIAEGQSDAYNAVKGTKTIAQRWNALPTAARIGIIAGGGSAVAFGVIVLTAVCWFQRRAGRKERLNSDAEFDNVQTEMNMARKESLVWR